MKKALTLATVVIYLGLTLPAGFSQQPASPPKQKVQTKAAASPDVPAEVQAAMEKLNSARKDLEQAGGEWGGFREAAIGNINQAIANLNKALEFRAKQLKK